MPFGSFDAKKAAKAAEEFSQQMGEIYRHECYGQRKRECKLKEKVIPKKKRLIFVNANIYINFALSLATHRSFTL